MSTRSAELRHSLRRSRRARLWMGVICIAIFGALALAAYEGLGQIIDARYTFAAAPSAHPEALGKGTGHLVWVDPGGCSVSEFDNVNGQLGTERYVSCSQFTNEAARHHQSPANRFKRFNSGFEK